MTENDDVSLDAPRSDRDRDGDLRDTDEEQGDESEIDDLFVVDATEARELDADLDGNPRDEPELD
jgi:hypothetical protein